ncbi:MAG: Alkaline phosphatase synthesis transcriptional regulatory protein PhoP [Bacteroidota bacterium]|jgi:two-component system alkaline phosphatase synthesis response regulator PhoP
MQYRILLVDDEQDILDLLQYNLEKEGFQVVTAQNGSEAVVKVPEFKPHLILMDVMMPEMDGMEACREIRELPDGKSTIIAFLTARSEDYSQMAGFEAGGDDYIAKPIKPRILVSKVKAWLKRLEGQATIAQESVDTGGLVIDKEKYIVTRGTEVFHLPKKEFELLALLVSAPGRVFTRDFILNSVWGNDVIVGDRTIDVHIRKLREKIGDEFFKTIKGVGYKFEP